MELKAENEAGTHVATKMKEDAIAAGEKAE